jgi:8-oxo-dGTP pyrophosphatase MutT (NUDIX family)
MINKSVIDKLAWICLKNKKVLGARSKGKDVFYLPGGKREPGETDHQALTREISEELSISLISHTLKHLHTFQGQAHGKDPGVMVQLTCYTGEFKGTIVPNAEIEAVEWLNSSDKDRCSETMQKMLDWLKARDLIA